MYYVDTYLREIIKEKDKADIAPPERYYEYRRGTMNDVIIETYIVSYDPLRLIDFAHAIGLDQYVLSITRDNFLEEHGVNKNATLYAYTVPPEWYDEEVAKVKDIIKW